MAIPDWINFKVKDKSSSLFKKTRARNTRDNTLSSRKEVAGS